MSSLSYDEAILIMERAKLRIMQMKDSLYKYKSEKYNNLDDNEEDETRRATQKSQLKQHVQSTHERITYECIYCDYKGKIKAYLQLHKKRKHYKPEQLCQHCDYKTGTKQTLKQHVDSKHKLIKFPCEHCEYRSTTRGNLKKHVKSKHG